MQSVFWQKYLYYVEKGIITGKRRSARLLCPSPKKGVIVPRISEDKQHGHKRMSLNAYSGVVSDGAKEFDSKFYSTTPKNIQFQCILITPSL